MSENFRKFRNRLRDGRLWARPFLQRREPSARAMTVHAQPLPHETPLTRPFWDGCRAGIPCLQCCLDCRMAFFYQRVRCPPYGQGALKCSTPQATACSPA